MACFSYRQYFPPLSSELSHTTYSPRIKREDDDVLPLHNSGPSSSRPSHQGHTYSQDGLLGPGLGYHRGDTIKRPGPGPLKEVWRLEEPNQEAEERTQSFASSSSKVVV